MAKVCEHCQTVLTSTASYNRHVENCKRNPKNQTEPEPDTQLSGTNDNPADLVIEVEAKDIEPQYQCGGCGGPVTKGQESCPKCGEPLEWVGL